MRLVLTALVALMLFSQVFARDIDLQGESVTVGPLAQQDFQTAHETINFIRTTDTPNELTLLYSLNVQVIGCCVLPTALCTDPIPVLVLADLAVVD
jgi:hypothetical protein